MPQFVFEAHSTDYQPVGALTGLVDDGFAILKVGPWLTFALREAIYGLAQIADTLAPDPWREAVAGGDGAGDAGGARATGRNTIPEAPDEQRVLRHFSLSDRIRYYWPDAAAEAAVARLMAALGERTIPRPLISQYLAHLEPAVASGAVAPDARALLLASVTRILDIYAEATGAI